jgi:hypothetical protein
MGVERRSIRIAVGPKDLENGTLKCTKRYFDKSKVKDGIATYIKVF